MDIINTGALTNHVAMRYARRICTDLEKGISLDQALTARCVPCEVQADLAAITSAIAAGWFAVPRGPKLTYSKTQHGSLTRLTERAPWLHDLLADATAFEAMRATLKPNNGPGFGVERLPNLEADALAARTRLTRLPLDHSAGELTLEFWVQILHDTQAQAAYIRNRIECLSPPWMWDANYPLRLQVAQLKAHDCLDLLHAFISTTRNRCLDRFERKLLDEVRYRSLSVIDYAKRWGAEIQRREEEAKAQWTENYRLIRRLAAMLDGVTSYHQASLTRRLRLESNGAFRLQRSGTNRNELIVEVLHQFCIGQSVKLESPFMLVNYCLALADEIETTAATFLAYLDACDRAYRRIKDLAEPDQTVSTHPQRRRADDFDTAAA